MEPDGKGFNLAVTAHRLGARVNGIFAIGTNAFSELASAAFHHWGLSVDMLVRYEMATGAGSRFVDGASENCLAVHLGANGRLSVEDVQRAEGAITASNLVMATFKVLDEPAPTAFTIARDAGRSTLLNPSPYRTLAPELLERTSMLIVNLIEAAYVSADFKPILDDEPLVTALARCLLERGPDTIVITLGGAGAVAFRRGHAPCFQPAIPAATVDMIGAGDFFSAGPTTGLVTELSFDTCPLRAEAVGRSRPDSSERSMRFPP